MRTVSTWAKRFHNKDPIDDRERPGVCPKFSQEINHRVISFFCQYQTLPGYARWTLSAAWQYFKENPGFLGKGITISRASIHRLLCSHALKPHRFRYFLQLCDPAFFEKMEHIIHIYATIKKHLYCFDECTGIQALEHIAPVIPAGPNRPECRESEYVRHGSVSVFSVLDVAVGKVFTRVIEDHTSATITAVFKDHVLSVNTTETLHYICDNYASHSTAEICRTVSELCEVELPSLLNADDRRKWLSSTGKRIVFHFLPCHGSWLNLIENWFGIMKKNCLDGCDVSSKLALAKNILDFTETWNQHYFHPFKWTYDGKTLREKTVRKFTYWIKEESSQLGGKFLGKQLDLMSGLFQKDYHHVPKHDWDNLALMFEQKQTYLYDIAENINADVFQHIKGKTSEERELKVQKKIKLAKQDLRVKIAEFKILLNSNPLGILNCVNE